LSHGAEADEEGFQVSGLDASLAEAEAEAAAAMHARMGELKAERDAARALHTQALL